MIRRVLIGVVVLFWMVTPARAGDGDGDGVLVEAPDPGTPEHLIQQVFVAAQFDDYRGFYGDLCDRSTCKFTDVAMESYRTRQWDKFKSAYKRCLVDVDALSYKYQRRSPKKVTSRTSKVTYYFVEGSMILKKDAEGAWKVYRLCE